MKEARENEMKAHCESCGREDFQTQEGNGYTVCCNELVCWGPGEFYGGDMWGNDEIAPVQACCGFVAEQTFKKRDGEVPATFWMVR
jgi:hypothetical protein